MRLYYRKRNVEYHLNSWIKDKKAIDQKFMYAYRQKSVWWIRSRRICQINVLAWEIDLHLLTYSNLVNAKLKNKMLKLISFHRFLANSYRCRKFHSPCWNATLIKKHTFSTRAYFWLSSKKAPIIPSISCKFLSA